MKDSSSITAEGVTFYLTAQAVDDTLAFIARNKGSNVIFDYTYTSVIDGTYIRPEVGSMKRSSKYTGEGRVYGIQEGKIGEFLEKRGSENVVNATGDDLQQMYFRGANAKRKVASIYCIVHATVKLKKG
jgi:O-methyltransferase involved in polyketide biosynthesis